MRFLSPIGLAGLLLAGLGCAPDGAGPILSEPEPIAAVQVIEPPVAGPDDRLTGGLDALIPSVITLTIETSEATWRAAQHGPAPLSLDIVPSDAISPWGLARPGTQPVLRAVFGGLKSTQEVEVTVPTRLLTEAMYAWVDFNQNGTLDVGDHVSGVVYPLGASYLRLETIWVTRLASPPPEPTALTFKLPASQVETHGRIMLLGWSQLGPGGLVPDEPPALNWRSEGRRREWPQGMVLTVTGLTELFILPVFDLTGDDQPGPGDLVARPLLPGAWEPGDEVTFAYPFGGGPR